MIGPQESYGWYGPGKTQFLRSTGMMTDVVIKTADGKSLTVPGDDMFEFIVDAVLNLVCCTQIGDRVYEMMRKAREDA